MNTLATVATVDRRIALEGEPKPALLARLRSLYREQGIRVTSAYGPERWTKAEIAARIADLEAGG